MITGLFISKNKAPFTFKQRNGIINTMLVSMMLLVPTAMILYIAPTFLLNDPIFASKIEAFGLFQASTTYSGAVWAIGSAIVCAILVALFSIATIRSISLLTFHKKSLKEQSTTVEAA